jgi:hypothetical protein
MTAYVVGDTPHFCSSFKQGKKKFCHGAQTSRYNALIAATISGFSKRPYPKSWRAQVQFFCSTCALSSEW